MCGIMRPINTVFLYFLLDIILQILIKMGLFGHQKNQVGFGRNIGKLVKIVLVPLLIMCLALNRSVA